MSTLCIANRKGGTGKTTMAVHVAAGLAILGYRVGLVDTDSQGHSGMMLGLPESDGLFNVLIDKRPLDQCVIEVPPKHYSTADNPTKGSLFVLPSAERTYKIPHLLKSDETFLFFDVIADMTSRYELDSVIIDTSPTWNLFDGAIYLATDHYLYVTEAERMSLDGVISAIDEVQRLTAQRQRHLHRDSSIIGIIPNKVRPTIVHRRNIEALQEHFGDLVWPAISLRTMWTEASNLNQTVFTYAPSGPEAEDAWAVIQKVQGALWPTVEPR